MRIRIWVRIRSQSQFEYQFNFNCHRFWGGGGRLVAIQTIAPQFMLYNLCDDHKHSRSFSICKTIFMTAPATISDTIFGNCGHFPVTPLAPDWHLKWTQMVCVRFIDAHPSDTTAFDQVRRKRRRRWRQRTCLSALCMTLYLCVCVSHSTSWLICWKYIFKCESILATKCRSSPSGLSCSSRLQIAVTLVLVNPKYQQVVCLYCTRSTLPALPVTCLSTWAANPLVWVCGAFTRNETLSSSLVYANIAHMTFRSLCRDFPLF